MSAKLDPVVSSHLTIISDKTSQPIRVDEIGDALDFMTEVNSFIKAATSKKQLLHEEVQTTFVDILKALENVAKRGESEFFSGLFSQMISLCQTVTELLDQKHSLEILQWLRDEITSSRATEHNVAVLSVINGGIVGKAGIVLVNHATLVSLLRQFLSVDSFTFSDAQTLPIGAISDGLMKTKPADWSREYRQTVFGKLEAATRSVADEDRVRRAREGGSGGAIITAGFVESFRELAKACETT